MYIVKVTINIFLVEKTTLTVPVLDLVMIGLDDGSSTMSPSPEVGA